MGVIHGEFEKLIPTSSTIDQLLNSTIHQSINNAINESNRDLSYISDNHDNCLDLTNFSPLFTDTSNSYKDIELLSNKIDLCIYTLMEYYIGTGTTDSASLFQNISPSDLNRFFSKILKNKSSSLKDITNRKSLMERIESGEYNRENYEKLLEKLMSDTSNNRDRTVSAALFMTMLFPEMPYFYGGGHEIHGIVPKGIDPKWGYDKKQTVGEHTGEYLPNSMDCSAFMSWCFKNANSSNKNVDNWTVNDYVNIGMNNSKVIDFNSEDVFSSIKPGDMTSNENNDHIGMIVDVNYDSREIIVAHCSSSGGGMNLTKMEIKDDGTSVIIDDSCDRDPDTSKINYFTKVLHLTYEGEKNE